MLYIKLGRAENKTVDRKVSHSDINNMHSVKMETKMVLIITILLLDFAASLGSEVTEETNSTDTRGTR